jgi:hypothetical protein
MAMRRLAIAERGTRALKKKAMDEEASEVKNIVMKNMKNLSA